MEALWSFYDTARSLTKYLAKLSHHGQAGTDMLLPTILQKLPKDIRDKWATIPEMDGKRERLECLFEFLQRHIQGLQLSQSYTVGTTDKVPQENKQQPSRLQGTATSLSVGTAPEVQELRGDPKCALCDTPYHTTAK